MPETNAERLKIIKNTPYLITDNVLLKDLKWLIKQAEESVKLCKLYNERGTALSNRSHENHWLKEENKRLREALREIKDEEEQDLEGYESVIYKIARQALEGTE